jgi:hypothetical protein
MGEENSKAELKELFSTKEALGIICYNKHHNQKMINCTRLSELLKIPINKLKETCSRLETAGVLKVHKVGPDLELEMLDKDNDVIRHNIDEIIWEYKQEYGKIYKKLITAELLDFMEGSK